MSLPIYIIGHKNPDSDSICSAIALSELKQKQGINAIPARLGRVAQETKFILDKLHLPSPVYLTSAKMTLSEIQIDDAITVSVSDNLRKGWDVALDKGAKTLYVVNDEQSYEGIVTVGDISRIQMQELTETAKLLKETPLESIVAALKGSFILKGNMERSGYVRIADKKMMARDLEGAIMVLDDSEDAMFKSIAKGAAVIIVAEGYQPDDLIIQIAKERGVTMISTNYNIMKILQMIYRSIPCGMVMTPSKNITRFSQNDYLEDVEKDMLKTRHTSYPVVNEKGNLVGSVARYHLLKAHKKKFILVDHNETSQSINDIDKADIVEIVDHHRIGDVTTDHPISFRNMIVGSTCTIVSLMYREANIEMSKTIATLLAYGMISDTMNFHSPTTTEIDKVVASQLTEKFGLNFDEMAAELFGHTATIKGKDFKSILYNDIKEYVLSGNHVAVSQVFIYDLDVVAEIHDDFKKYMKEQNDIRGYDLFVMVFTNVEGKGSKFIAVGKFAEPLDWVFESFEKKGYVSRKKQIVPCIAEKFE
ncbi:MAG: putative manganese-dependent inorganic diphosphatase [Holdemanella sp.]|nr:putative manganese-dependent inorganic diphosphatase [Holdemanella sp.]